MVQQNQKATKPQGSFYVPAKLVRYDLPSIVEDENELNQLIALKVDESFHSKLKDVDHSSLYNAFVDQLDHHENPIILRTPEAEGNHCRITQTSRCCRSNALNDAFHGLRHLPENVFFARLMKDSIRPELV